MDGRGMSIYKMLSKETVRTLSLYEQEVKYASGGTSKPRVVYQPFEKVPSCEKTLKKYHIRVGQTKLGEGSYGSVWEACTPATCSVVAKRIEIPATMSYIQSFWFEVLVGRRAGRLKYGPRIHRAFTCPSDRRGYITGYIIMQKVGKSLYDHIGAVDWHALSDTIQLMHDDGVYHQDLFSRNICLKRKGNGYYIIDWGAAIKYDPGQLPNLMIAADWAGLMYGMPARLRGKYHSKDLYDKVIERELKSHFGTTLWEAAIRARVDREYSHGLFRYSGTMDCTQIYAAKPPGMPDDLWRVRKFWRSICT